MPKRSEPNKKAIESGSSPIGTGASSSEFDSKSSLAVDWREALGGYTVQATAAEPVQADAAAVAGMLQHWEEALTAIGFLDPASPKKLMPRLNQLFNRAHLSPEEIHILRGVAKAMTQKALQAAGKAATQQTL
jgi:tRNA/rRNA methyltransferase